MRKLGEWGVLLFLLVIPAALFLYWQKTAAARRQSAMQAATPAAQGTSGMFQGREGSPALSNPLRAGNPPAPQGVSDAQAPVKSDAAAVPEQAAVPFSGPALLAAVPSHAASNEATFASVPAVVPSTAPATGDPAAVVAASSSTCAGLFCPKTQRDPMQSVTDRALLEMMSVRSRISKEMEEKMAAEANKAVKKKKKNIEDLISLQGIMEIRGTMTAIVNGDMVSKGQKVMGANVVKITATSVIFEHKGKVFTKQMKRIR